MKHINRLPQFMPGQVIDISFKCTNGVPDRLLVTMVAIREQDKNWIYRVLMESTGEQIYLTEKDISNNMVNKYAQVYNCKEVLGLYSEGWRFCGNYTKQVAEETGAKLATIRNIKNIILRPALDASGNPLPNHYGVWIRYNMTINNDGTVATIVADDSVIVIK